jgi:predicted deacylase
MNALPADALLPIDIAPYRAGNTGIPYVTTFDSGRAGPHVVINALTHGNEVCGAHALAWLFGRGVRPRRGKLTLSFANVAAYESFDPRNPTASRYLDEDFNRVWAPATLDGPLHSRELDRARELRPVIAAADFLLDVHSMQTPSPALVLSGLQAKGRALAAQVGVPEWVVADAGHAAGPRMRDYGAFADEASPRTALLVECGQHWLRASREIAIDCCRRFLAVTGAVDPADLDGPFPGPPRQRFIEVSQAVTIESDGFTFAGDYVGLEVIPAAGTVIGHDGERPVATPYDDCVLIMPTRRLKRGQTAVRFGRIVG